MTAETAGQAYDEQVKDTPDTVQIEEVEQHSNERSRGYLRSTQCRCRAVMHAGRGHTKD